MDYLQYRRNTLLWKLVLGVLNLVINGLPSILYKRYFYNPFSILCFKPCYKWITFNTQRGVPHIIIKDLVLNLVINGLPSILIHDSNHPRDVELSFKPCYKWITFNTEKRWKLFPFFYFVLNLVINGLPSILKGVI